jgi:hypothetical protein
MVFLLKTKGLAWNLEIRWQSEAKTSFWRIPQRTQKPDRLTIEKIAKEELAEVYLLPKRQTQNHIHALRRVHGPRVSGYYFPAPPFESPHTPARMNTVQIALNQSKALRGVLRLGSSLK